MLNLWKKYNFIIILLALSYLFAFIIVLQNENTNMNDYINVNVKEGDTLWGIANKYAKQSNMYQEQFIQWVEKTNDIMRNEIEAGESLIIPIKAQDFEHKSVASSQ